MGGKDAAYNRNQTAADCEKMLADLRTKDPEGYPHRVTIHADKGHWMDREDAVAVPWMMQYRRDRFPKRVVWKQDDVTRDPFLERGDLLVGGFGVGGHGEVIDMLHGGRESHAPWPSRP